MATPETRGASTQAAGVTGAPRLPAVLVVQLQGRRILHGGRRLVRRPAVTQRLPGRIEDAVGALWLRGTVVDVAGLRVSDAGPVRRPRAGGVAVRRCRCDRLRRRAGRAGRAGRGGRCRAGRGRRGRGDRYRRSRCCGVPRHGGGWRLVVTHVVRRHGARARRGRGPGAHTGRRYRRTPAIGGRRGPVYHRLGSESPQADQRRSDRGALGRRRPCRVVCAIGGGSAQDQGTPSGYGHCSRYLECDDYRRRQCDAGPQGTSLRRAREGAVLCSVCAGAGHRMRSPDHERAGVVDPGNSP